MDGEGEEEEEEKKGNVEKEGRTAKKEKTLRQ